jgi:hypothetical protein
MSIDLTVAFDGLCVFVPTTRNRDKMTVLLVNALEECGSHGDHHTHVPAHFPHIGFAEGSLCRPLPPDLQFTRGNDGRRGVRLLRWVDIEIDRAGARGRLSIAGGRRPGSAEPLFNGDERDFSWLAELGQIDDEWKTVDPLCLAPDPPRNRVIARAYLNFGEIFVDGFAEIAPGLPFIWEFRTIDGMEVSPLCQALAAKVVWRATIDAPEVIIRLWPFSGADPTELAFVPVIGNSVSLEIQNLPLESVVGVLRAEYAVDQGFQHFPVLSKVLKGQYLKQWVPSAVPQADADRGGAVRGGTTLCIGGSSGG